MPITCRFDPFDLVIARLPSDPRRPRPAGEASWRTS
jgi:hypothetical protein